MIRNSLFLLLLFVGTSQLHAAGVKYVTDIFEVTMRSGTTTSNSIVRLLRSGESVTVLEDDPVSQYSMVELSLIHISEPTRLRRHRMPASA